LISVSILLEQNFWFAVELTVKRDHDVHGPAGPTAFWKINDHLDGGADYDSEEEEDDDWTEDPEEVLEAIASLVGFQADLG
jgi:hypothetical protein